MKKRILYIILLLTFLSVKAQNKLADSLVVVASSSKNEVEKLKTFNAISSAYKTTSGLEVINYGKKALVLAQKLNLKTEEGKAYLNLGNGNIIIGDYNKALNSFFKAETIFKFELEKNKTIENKKALAKAYGSIGIVFSEQSNYSRAFQYYLKSITLYEELNDINMLSRLYNNVGVAYQSQEEYGKALNYFKEAKTRQKQLKSQNIGITLTNIANCYLKLKKDSEALLFYNQAEQFVKDNPRALGEWNNSIGRYYYENKNNKKALEHWNKAILAFNTIGDKFGIADTYIFKSELLLTQEKYEEVIVCAKKALVFSTETNVLAQMVLLEKILFLAYEKQNNLSEALKHHKLFLAFQDSLLNTQSIRKGMQAEMNFEYEKKENTKRLEREKQDLILAQKMKQRNLKYGFIAFSVLLLISLGIVLYNRKQLKKRLVLEKELAEYEQKALHLQMNPHFIFNCLGAISGFIINNGTDHAIKYLSKFSKLMRLTLEYSKESLIPIEKEIESIQNYLELEKLRFSNAFDFKINKSKAIEDDVAILPLLVQPIVENAVIHGIIPKKEKGNLIINFDAKDGMIICEVIDNGVGIDNSIKTKENSVQVHKSMALDIIKKRLKMITEVSSKATSIKSFQINDSNGNSEGTKVVISLPIQYID